MRCLVVTVCLLAIASSAGADDYFPMCVGSAWNYLGLESGAGYETQCTGTQLFYGVDCAVFANSGPQDNGLSQFYYKDHDGATIIRGWFRNIEGWGLLYDPGIKMLSGAPYLGEEWCHSVDVYDLPDYVYRGTYTFCFAVLEEGDIDLPAGTFHSYGVGEVEPVVLRPGFDFLGRERPSSLSAASRWYSESIGVVQFITADNYQLASYSLPPSAVDAASWGRIKALYRPSPLDSGD